NEGNPVEGKMVDFEVTSGPNAGTTYSEATDANGEVFFTYSSAVSGADQVQACFLNSQGDTQCSNTLTVNWMVPQAENIVLTQDINTLPIGNMHTVTATLYDEMSNPIAGRQVDFEVISGPHAGTTYSESTDINGEAFFSYEGTVAGSDQIEACFENSDMAIQCSNILTFLWTDGQGGFENCIPEGWSIISSPYETVNPAFSALFSDLVNNDQVIILLNKNGFWWPSQNVNTLGEWNSDQAYKIKLTEEGCVQFGNVPVMNMLFDFEPGISYLPVPVDQGVIASDIFDQLGGSLLYAFDLSGGLAYWPAGGIFTLQTLVPGKGYIINLTAPGSVDFGMAAKSSSVTNSIQVLENAPWSVTKTGAAHLISLKASALTMFDKGDIIAAFSEEGICIGMVTYQADEENLALIAYGDDQSTLETDGLEENEIISFRAFDASENSIINLQAEFDASMPNTQLFAEYGASAVNNFKTEALSVDEKPGLELMLYPNPASDVVNVTALNANAVITLTNAQGQIVRTVNATAGENLSLDLSSLSRGIYFLNARSADSSTTHKVFVK
ncbi:MAG: Ig-like domain-containing protein, partial [Bacteroidales bacterium]